MMPSCATRRLRPKISLRRMSARWTFARGLKAAAALLDDGSLETDRKARDAGWQTQSARDMLAGGLEECTRSVLENKTDPAPRSGRQERLENIVNRDV